VAEKARSALTLVGDHGHQVIVGQTEEFALDSVTFVR